MTENSSGMRRAFALVSLAHPRLTFEAWIRFLKRATRPSGSKTGVVFVEDLRGYPHAVFRYAVDERPSLAAAESQRPKRTLRLSDLVAADVGTSCRLAAIARFGERLAGELGCETVIIELPGVTHPDDQRLEGYETEAGGVIFRRIAERARLTWAPAPAA